LTPKRPCPSEDVRTACQIDQTVRFSCRPSSCGDTNLIKVRLRRDDEQCAGVLTGAVSPCNIRQRNWVLRIQGRPKCHRPELRISVRRTQRGLPRSELVERICGRQQQLSCDDVRLAVDVILDAIARQLASGGRVEIRNFGTFAARLRRARVGRNPRTGERVDVPVRRIPRFTPSRSLVSAPAQVDVGAFCDRLRQSSARS